MWTVLDHTADLRVAVAAPSWPELLAEAVRAFAGVVTGAPAAAGAAPPAEARPELERAVEVDGRDAAETWVRWWRALHRLLVVEGLLPVSARIAQASPTRASASVACVPRHRAEPATDVKAVTWHRAEAGPDADGAWRGTIVLDV